MQRAFQDGLNHPAKSTDENNLQDLITLIHRENLDIGPVLDAMVIVRWGSFLKRRTSSPWGMACLIRRIAIPLSVLRFLMRAHEKIAL
jgi:hypothetical protein